MRPSPGPAVRAPGGAGPVASRSAPSGHEPQPRAAGGRGLVPDPDPHDPAAQVPEEYAAAFARVAGAPARGQLLRGEPDLPRSRWPPTSTRWRRTCGCARSTPRRTPGSCSTTCRAPGPGCSAPRPERYATGRPPTACIETRPIKGTTPRDPDPARDAELRARLAREPKFRGENLMIVDLLRNDLSMVCAPGTRRGAGPDARRVLPERAPARLDGARPAARRRHDGRGAARALPGRLDDRRAQAAHDGDHRRRSRPRRAGRTPARSAGWPPTAAPTSGVVIRSLTHGGRRPLAPRHRRRHHGALRRRRGVRRVALEGRAAAARCSAGPEPDHCAPGRPLSTRPRTPAALPASVASTARVARTTARGRTTRAGRRSRSRPGRRSGRSRSPAWPCGWRSRPAGRRPRRAPAAR